MSLGGTLHVIGLAFGLAILYLLGSIFYNLFLHPLRKFPGPFWMRATRAAYCYKLVFGTLPFEILDLHNYYGDVVRIAPDELAFSDREAWKEIMGHRIKDNKRPTFEKYERFYRPNGGPTDIANSSGTEHQVLRRLLSNGFSDRSLREQEPIVKRYVDLLLQRLHENSDRPVDIMSWYNYTTFDVIGDLAFGEPFGCLDNSDYHPWVRIIFEMARFGTVNQTAGYFPLLRNVLTRILSTKTVRSRGVSHRALTREKLLRRMELGKNGGRPDLIDNLLKKQEELGITEAQLLKNCGALIVGGSETTATLLSGVTYLLLKTPEALRKLTAEVRSSFKTEEEINFTSVNKLSYMLACLEEAFRMYPPIAGGLPRQIPKGGSEVSGRFIPEYTVVAIHQWAMYHNTKHFKDPFTYHPERFLGDPKFESDHKDVLQPFHVGPRNCLGRNLAYVEMRVILARIIWNFDLSLAEQSQDWLERQKFDSGPIIANTSVGAVVAIPVNQSDSAFEIYGCMIDARWISTTLSGDAVALLSKGYAPFSDSIATSLAGSWIGNPNYGQRVRIEPSFAKCLNPQESTSKRTIIHKMILSSGIWASDGRGSRSAEHLEAILGGLATNGLARSTPRATPITALADPKGEWWKSLCRIQRG
ncbi:hypothetical protein BHE90_011521 [Fusarium euwallaceae]|uniref:Uncharacterized protein n=2 Tax=Fusarium solani species complex TaxID=232080 RepID=A0A430LEB2_9HYPO|nr:hypothetical protein CEP51_000124 [Fusarium floridanum]RTE74055.1 hypothetical protein BHE90_011521 [Fusarium euwallaceae]